MRVRFHGRLVDAFILERRSETDHVGKLGWLDRVVSAERVLTPEVRRLADAVAARYAGTRADVLRLAIPPRHANVEKEAPAEPGPVTVAPVDTAGWAEYGRGEQFFAALRDGRAARAVWQALPGERWADRLAEAAAATVGAGRGVLAIVPDQRDVDALRDACVRLVDESRVVALSAGLGPAQRYRRWLSVLRGSARLVIGTRSAVFAPVADLGLVLVWDDGDDTLAEPRAPYPHAREVAMLRAHQLRCAALIGGYSRTAEAQALVRSRWAHDLVAARPVVRSRAPRVTALEDSGYAAGARPGRPQCPAAVDGAAGRANRAGCRTPRAGPGAAQGLCARAGLRPLPHHRPLQALHRPAVAARPGRRRVRCAAGAAVRNPRCAVPGADPTPSARLSSVRAEPQRNSAGRFPAPPSSPPAATPSCPRCRASRPLSSPPRAPNRWQRVATAPRCCWTPGPCSVARTCVRPRTRCAAGWPPPRWSAAVATAGWWPSSPSRRCRPCRH